MSLGALGMIVEMVAMLVTNILALAFTTKHKKEMLDSGAISILVTHITSFVKLKYKHGHCTTGVLAAHLQWSRGLCFIVQIIMVKQFKGYPVQID